MKRKISLSVVALSVLALLSITVLPTAAAQYGAIQGQGHSPISTQAPQVVKEHQISIAYAQQLTSQLDGGKGASRMLHRVTTPMASQL